jgi:hypothetical protein
MANKDRPAGLKPVKHLNGSPWNGKTTMYYKAAGLNEAIFIGSPVKSAGSADATGKYPTVQLAGQDAARGVVVGIGNTPYLAADLTDLDLTNSPVSTAHYLMVADDPDLIFECQEDSSTAFTADSIGCNADLTTESGNTSTGHSTVEIDCATETTTSTLQVKILRLVDRPDNELGNYAKFEIMFNQHELGQGLGSTGV